MNDSKERLIEISKILAKHDIVHWVNPGKLKIILEHLDLVIQEKGEYTAVREMRKHIAWYIKGQKDATKIRERINEIEDKDELRQVLIEYYQAL